MQGISVDDSQSNFIESKQEMILRFTTEVSVDAERWSRQLIQCPADLEAIERLVHNAYARGADMLVAGMMAATIKEGQIGFGKGVSPGLQSRVARKVALNPSIAFAHTELTGEGVKLDAKAIRRITYQCGEGLLALRRHRIKLLRARKLKAGKELAGKRVSVQIDGGRMKIRGEMKPKAAAIESTDADGLLIGGAPG